MRVLKVAPGKEPETLEIEGNLTSLQKEVEEYVEAVQLSPTVAILCNEEGLIRQIPFNFYVQGHHLHGPVLFVGTDDSENFVSLRDEDMREWTGYVRERTAL